jgi:hypothetical protein
LARTSATWAQCVHAQGARKGAIHILKLRCRTRLCSRAPLRRAGGARDRCVAGREHPRTRRYRVRRRARGLGGNPRAPVHCGVARRSGAVAGCPPSAPPRPDTPSQTSHYNWRDQGAAWRGNTAANNKCCILVAGDTDTHCSTARLTHSVPRAPIARQRARPGLGRARGSIGAWLGGRPHTDER